MAEHREELLTRSWTHSHEEDHDGLVVYRPSERDFPPARGRESFTLIAGGELEQVGPGPDDRPVTSHGSWSFDADRLELQRAGAAPVSYVVDDVGPDLLVMRVADT